MKSPVLDELIKCWFGLFTRSLIHYLHICPNTHKERVCVLRVCIGTFFVCITFIKYSDTAQNKQLATANALPHMTCSFTLAPLIVTS